MHRTRIATAVVIAAVASCSVALTAEASRSTAPPCTPKIATIDGHKAAVNCGPATVTLDLSGRTYTFRDGFCMKSKSTGALQLDLGTNVVGVKGNAGKPDFTMLITKFHTAYGSGSVFGADYGGKDLFPNGQTLINVRGKLPAAGTFTSSFTLGAKFTGSWNCHGVVWQER